MQLRVCEMSFEVSLMSQKKLWVVMWVQQDLYLLIVGDGMWCRIAGVLVKGDFGKTVVV